MTDNVEHYLFADLSDATTDEVICGCKKWKGTKEQFAAHLESFIEPEPVPVADLEAMVDPRERMDRCDASQAERGTIRALLPDGGELLLCGHHATKFTATLVGKGATLVDIETGQPIFAGSTN